MIDFSNIQNIVIPEGEVAVIARGAEILWRKQRYKKELLYLESTGTQWIDMGVTINTATDETELVFQNNEQTVYKWFFGEHDNNARFSLGSGDGVNKRNVAYGGNTYKVKDEQLYNSMHRFTANQSGIFLDDVKIANFSSFSSTSTLYLFNLNLNDGSYMGKSKIWSYKHKRNGTAIRDFIPVLDWSDRPCMYDKVSDELFYNKGTGEFLYGEIPTKPYKTEVEYLESNGTQYINTGKYAPSNTDIEVKFQLANTTQAAANNGAIFGGRSAQTSNTCTLFYLASVNPQYFRFDRTGQQQLGTSNEITIDVNSVYLFKHISNQTSIENLTTTEKITKGLGTPSSFTTAPIYLFAVNTSGNAGTFLKGKIYEWKYWENGELTQHLIPVLDWNDRPCMYDKVSGELFYNQGSGEFLYSSITT